MENITLPEQNQDLPRGGIDTGPKRKLMADMIEFLNEEEQNPTVDKYQKISRAISIAGKDIRDDEDFNEKRRKVEKDAAKKTELMSGTSMENLPMPSDEEMQAIEKKFQQAVLNMIEKVGDIYEES